MQLWKRLFKGRYAEREATAAEQRAAATRERQRKARANETRLDKEVQQARILNYRRQRGLQTHAVKGSPEGPIRAWLVLGKLEDLTPRQQRRVKHRFNRGLVVHMEEVFAS